jgi:hypothetical protein
MTYLWKVTVFLIVLLVVTPLWLAPALATLGVPGWLTFLGVFVGGCFAAWDEDAMREYYRERP